MSGISVCLNFGGLVTESDIKSSGADWHRELLGELEERLNKESSFPCVFAKNANRKKLIRFIFVDSLDAQGIQRLATALVKYVELSDCWDGSIDNAYPLVIGFADKLVEAEQVLDYHAFGWQVLQQLHQLDPGAWPTGVAQDPSSPEWSMCFNGMSLFVNMSNPGHQVRRSRNLGKYFIMVVNPRERFDVFAGDTPGGRKVRENIRKRILIHDGITHAQQLGSYGTNSLEWEQYGLIEQNQPREDRCPFRFIGTK